MPAADAPAKVLVTGANGYLGVWLVRTLLEHGYRVRGTVRTVAKGDLLKIRVADLGGEFEYVLVEDVLRVRFYWTSIQRSATYLSRSPGWCLRRRCSWYRHYYAHSVAERSQ